MKKDYSFLPFDMQLVTYISSTFYENPQVARFGIASLLV
jgi:hypothetical protein